MFVFSCSVFGLCLSAGESIGNLKGYDVVLRSSGLSSGCKKVAFLHLATIAKKSSLPDVWTQSKGSKPFDLKESLAEQKFPSFEGILATQTP